MKKLSFLVLLASISCGGGNETAPPSTTPSTPSATPSMSASAMPSSSAMPASSGSAAPAASSSAAPAGGGQVAWKDMDKKARATFMRETVVPAMKEKFQAFDKKKFEKFGCGTCHGAGAADGSFKMPNPQIFVLPGNKEGFEALGKTKGDWMKFMGGTVKPEMAKLLGQSEMDPSKPEAGGFGCLNCHTMKK